MRATRHGDLRIRQRTGLPRKAVLRQIARALKLGKERVEFKGPFRRYLDKLYHYGLMVNRADKIIVYGNDIYLFAMETLITTWPVPNKFREKKQGMKMNDGDGMVLEALGESIEDE